MSEQLKAMKEGIERAKQLGIEAIDDRLYSLSIPTNLNFLSFKIGTSKLT